MPLLPQGGCCQALQRLRGRQQRQGVAERSLVQVSGYILYSYSYISTSMIKCQYYFLINLNCQGMAGTIVPSYINKQLIKEFLAYG